MQKECIVFKNFPLNPFFVQSESIDWFLGAHQDPLIAMCELPFPISTSLPLNLSLTNFNYLQQNAQPPVKTWEPLSQYCHWTDVPLSN